MKYLFLSLLTVLPTLTYAVTITKDNQLKFNSLPPTHTFMPASLGTMRDCTGCKIDDYEEFIKERSEKYKRFVNLSDDLKKAEDAKDDKKIIQVIQDIHASYYELARLDQVLANAKSEYLEEKVKKLEKERDDVALKFAQCKGTTPEPSLIVDDSNRSFFGKVMDVFNWKRDTPAPVEDRVLSK